MESLVLALLLLAAPLAPAAAQSPAPPPAQEPAAGETTGAPSVEAFARKIAIVTSAKTATEIPENEPLAVDLGLVDVPGIPKRLTDGVTAKGYARHVVVDGEMIGQLVLTAVEKDDKAEALDSKDFTAQFTMERPELDPSSPVTVEGDEEELKAALERLAENKDDAEKDTETAEADTGTAATTPASNAGENSQAAAYQTPDALPPSEKTSAPSVRVTTEGCKIRVDLDQLQAIQQNRVETTEDGQVTLSDCEDGDERYPIVRGYSACGDAVDLEARTATTQYLLYYTNGDGTRNEVSDCQPDPDQVFEIAEDRNACTIQIDYQQKQAIPRAALVYTNANNKAVQVRGCQASEEVAAVPLVSTTDGCSIRHDFAAGASHQQGRYTYDLDGVTWQAGGCIDNGTDYPHRKVYETATGTAVCPALVDEDKGTVTLQSKTAITVGGVEQYITDCTPDAGTLALVATTDGCDNPATWTHDVNAGVSYGQERYYYTDTGDTRQYVTECRNAATTYPHQVETVGWDNHDTQLFAYPRTTVYITPPSGRYDILTDKVLSGAVQTPYVYTAETEVANGEQWYEECTRYEGRDLVQSYARPDGSTYKQRVGDGEPVSKGNVCTSDRPDTPADWTISRKDWSWTYWAGNPPPQLFERVCHYDAVRTTVREDGVEMNRQAATKTNSQAYYRNNAPGYVVGYTRSASSLDELKSRIASIVGSAVFVLAGVEECPDNPPPADVSTWLGELGW